VDFSGVLAQAPGSDTVGWFARDGETFARVCEAVFGAPPPATLPDRLIVATDTFAFADPEVAAALAPMVDRLASLIGDRRERILAPQGLSVWQGAQRCLQSSEAWQTLQPWIDATNPRFAFSVARGLTIGSMITDNERTRAALMREEVRGRLRMLLPPGTILCLPTTPFPAPQRGLAISDLAFPRERISALTCLGGLTGSPQVNLPGALVGGAPVGLSIVGARGSDLELAAVARAFGART
jgi:amidase